MSGECEQAYGILPCSTTASGSAFLCLFFGYSVLKGAELIGEGSELLLNILHPGLVGGLLLPVLGSLPDAAIILASASGPAVRPPPLLPAPRPAPRARDPRASNVAGNIASGGDEGDRGVKGAWRVTRRAWKARFPGAARAPEPSITAGNGWAPRRATDRRPDAPLSPPAHLRRRRWPRASTWGWGRWPAATCCC